MTLEGNPVLLWVGVIIGAAIIIAQAFPKILGPVGESIRAWASSRRASESEEEESLRERHRKEIEAREREKAYYKGVADERLRELQARDELIGDHMIWDRERVTAAIAAGAKVPPPPPLFPRMPIGPQPPPPPAEED